MPMRFSVEGWAPEYGTPEDPTLMQSQAAVDPNVEVAIGAWAPRRPAADLALPASIVFVDGVRRIDARVWIRGDDPLSPQLGICATYGAGAVRSDAGRAELVAATVESGLFTAAPQAAPIETRSCGTYRLTHVAEDSADALILAVQNEMARLEANVARAAGAADLIVLDGPLRDRTELVGAVGYVKTHRSDYLPVTGQAVVAALSAGERTPLFAIGTHGRNRFSWYLRLPGGTGHTWAGVVRCEVAATSTVAQAVQFADQVTATVPRFASTPHRDPRAPQNLLPIGGLEKALRHRLGDARLRMRALSEAARSVPA